MFGKIKNWLGIESVKIEIQVDDELTTHTEELSGRILFYSQRPQEVTHVHVQLVEKYTRGRKKNKLIDRYVLGEMSYDRSFEVPAHQFMELDFDLPVTMLKSDMDRLGELSFITRGLVQIAKKVKNANSTYKLEVRATIKGKAVETYVEHVLHPTV